MKLIKTEIGKKSAKYLYQIVDENGNVLAKRFSNREYVAATICGKFFFGNLKFTFQGEHQRHIDWEKSDIERYSSKSANELENNYNKTYGELLQNATKRLIGYQTIAKI